MSKTIKAKTAIKAKKPAAAVKVVSAKKSAAPVKVTVKGSKTTIKMPAQTQQKKPAPPVKAKVLEAVSAPVVEKKMEKLDFVAGDFVVYPAHGVGQVEGVEEQTIAGMSITLYTICFEKD